MTFETSPRLGQFLRKSRRGEPRLDLNCLPIEDELIDNRADGRRRLSNSAPCCLCKTIRYLPVGGPEFRHEAYFIVRKPKYPKESMFPPGVRALLETPKLPRPYSFRSELGENPVLGHSKTQSRRSPRDRFLDPNRHLRHHQAGCAGWRYRPQVTGSTGPAHLRRNVCRPGCTIFVGGVPDV